MSAALLLGGLLLIAGLNAREASAKCGPPVPINAGATSGYVTVCSGLLDPTPTPTGVNTLNVGMDNVVNQHVSTANTESASNGVLDVKSSTIAAGNRVYTHDSVSTSGQASTCATVTLQNGQTVTDPPGCK